MLYEFNEPKPAPASDVETEADGHAPRQGSRHRRDDSGYAEGIGFRTGSDSDLSDGDAYRNANEEEPVALTPASTPNANGDELAQLKAHAQRILAIHDWEWTDVEVGVDQAAEAVRLFEEAISAFASAPTSVSASTSVADGDVSKPTSKAGGGPVELENAGAREMDLKDTNADQETEASPRRSRSRKLVFGSGFDRLRCIWRTLLRFCFRPKQEVDAQKHKAI